MISHSVFMGGGRNNSVEENIRYKKRGHIYQTGVSQVVIIFVK